MLRLSEVKLKIFLYLEECFYKEHRSLFLWIAVLFASGILIYFGINFEPKWYISVIAVSCLLIIYLLFRNKYTMLSYISFSLLIIALGFGNASFRSYYLDSPIIPNDGFYELEGRIINVDNNYKGIERYIISDLLIYGQDIINTPKKIRLTIRTENNGAEIGDIIKVRARLSKPPRPVIPNGYNFARKAYFSQIGAIGFSLSDIEIIKEYNDNNRVINNYISYIRDKISSYNNEILGTEKGAISSALLVGKRYAIDDEILDNIRASGIAHLLAISGLHLVMVTGITFLVIRKLLSLSLYIAEYYNTKKLAAIVAILVGFFYLAITGYPVSAQRAFLMSLMFFLAIMIDRESMPIYSVAWSALIILIISPENILEPGFQMSYSAVIALVSSYSFFNERLNRNNFKDISFIRKSIKYIFNIALSSFIASLATTPFAIYHFNQYSLYGIITNLIAVPLTTLWVMPFGMLSMLLYPLNLGYIALIPMGWGIDILISISSYIAGLPNSSGVTSSLSSNIILLMVFGGLWLALWVSSIRIIGGIIIIISIIIAYIKHDNIADIIIGGENDISYAFIDKINDRILYSDNYNNNYQDDIWAKKIGVENKYNISDIEHDNYLCDEYSCIYKLKGKVISFIKDPMAISEDCEKADILVNMTYYSEKDISISGCRDVDIIINRYDLHKNGTYIITIVNNDIQIDNVSDNIGNRLWSR